VLENNQLGQTTSGEREVPSPIIGNSLRMQLLRRTVETVAKTEVSVVVTGETGTGKELVVQSLHEMSSRRGFPLVSLNCAAIPDSLLESELFGFERGTFTGAETQRDGVLMRANGGTLFLDEIGELSSSSQAKILRVAEDKQVRRIGSAVLEPVDVRFVSATHRDLCELVTQGGFRADLLYRLNVINICIPPLRERREDIPLLAETFLELLCRKYVRVKKLTQGAVDYLQSHNWPGNVRELRNVIERAFILSSSDVLSAPELIPLGSSLRYHSLNVSQHPDFKMKTRSTPTIGFSEREALSEALRITKWNKTKAAQMLSWSRMRIYRKIVEYELQRP
jgi:transcriptional regulator with PAS, ATPase and Fis domain